MNRNSVIKQLAEKLGFQQSDSPYDEDQLATIAEQADLVDYMGTDEDLDKLYEQMASRVREVDPDFMKDLEGSSRVTERSANGDDFSRRGFKKLSEDSGEFSESFSDTDEHSIEVPESSFSDSEPEYETLDEGPDSLLDSGKVDDSSSEDGEEGKGEETVSEGENGYPSYDEFSSNSDGSENDGELGGRQGPMNNSSKGEKDSKENGDGLGKKEDDPLKKDDESDKEDGNKDKKDEKNGEEQNPSNENGNPLNQPNGNGENENSQGRENGSQNPENGQKGKENPKESEDGDKPANSEDDKKKGENSKGDSPSDKSETPPNGNGYGALRNGGKPKGEMPKSGNKGVPKEKAENANKNKKANPRNFTSRKDGSSGLPSLSGAANSLKNRASNFIKSRLGGKDTLEDSDGSGKEKKGKKFADFAKKYGKTIIKFLMKHPVVLVILAALFLLFFVIIIAIIGADQNNKNNKSGKYSCTYNLSGVTSGGSVELSDLKVELVNCDATESNYKVLETVDFEKYVLGVALAEIGPDSPDEAIKSQIIAARNFSLTRNKGMCPANQDNCFFGYNASSNLIRMRACEADQVYWDYDKDIYRENRGAISLYSPEVQEGTKWKSALSAQRKNEVLALASAVKGEVFVDNSGNVVSTNYDNSTSSQFLSLANEGKTYKEILNQVYDNQGSINSGKCTYSGAFDYGDYILDSDSSQILHTPLGTFLSSKGTSLEEFNTIIESNVEQAGYGTRAGVVAAGVTLIAELSNNYGVKVPYFWGGGHYDGVALGALDYWGSNTCHATAYNQSYNYCGLDCSGFVPWAMKNGGFNKGVDLANRFQKMEGAKRVTLRNYPVVQPGDLLESSGHVVLVVDIDEEKGQYVCAEASGNESGVQFTRRPFNSSGYWGVDLEEYYSNQNNVRVK